METSTFDYCKFRDNLRQLITGRGLTIKGLCEDVNIRAATISRYLSGDRTPDLPYAITIAQYFNVSLDWLLGLNGDKFDIMPQEVQSVATNYQLATPDDRKVVQAVLSKYNSKE